MLEDVEISSINVQFPFYTGTFWLHWKMGKIIQIKDMFTKSPPIPKWKNV